MLTRGTTIIDDRYHNNTPPSPFDRVPLRTLPRRKIKEEPAARALSTRYTLFAYVSNASVGRLEFFAASDCVEATARNCRFARQ